MSGKFSSMTNQAKPIKRNRALQSFSREHHLALQFCWKLRQGFKNKTEPERMKRYADWFGEHYLIPHFALEEKYVFPIIGNDNAMVKKALLEHRRLKRLLNETADVATSLNRLEEELERHIRFEERSLFKEVEKIADATQLETVEKHHGAHTDKEGWEDEFWL